MTTLERKDYDAARYKANRLEILAQASTHNEVTRRQAGYAIKGKFVSKSESNRRYREKQKKLTIITW